MVGVMGYQGGKGSNVPADVLIEIARSPDDFEKRIQQYQKERAESVKEAANAAKVLKELKAESDRFQAAQAETNRQIAADNAMMDEEAAKLDERERKLALDLEKLAEDRLDLAAERKAFNQQQAQYDKHVAAADERLAAAAAEIEETRGGLVAEGRRLDHLKAQLRDRQAKLAELEAAIHVFLSSGA